MAAPIDSSLPVTLLRRCVMVVAAGLPARGVNGNFPEPEESTLMVRGAR